MLKRTIIVIMLVTMVAVLYAGNRPMKRNTSVNYWIANVKGGVSYPVGETQLTKDPLFNVGISVRKGLDMEFSAGGGITYAVMPDKTETSPGDLTATIIDVEGAWAPYLPDFIVHPYLKVGFGLFLLKFPKQVSAEVSEHASETTLGFLFGLGANYPLGKVFAVNVEVLMNSVSLAGGTGDSSTFITADLGVMMYLK